jgi:thiamine pyrophosphokinase|tara:strand:- start:1814 stop:2491 length:678 start_codon:yes stop_codon:yes gene_type:complete
MFEGEEPMPSALIVTGGNLEMNSRVQSIIEKSDYIVAADAGVEHCLQHKIIPDLVVGDFDSIKSESMELVKQLNWNIETFPEEKDKTDGELALLKALEQKAHEIWIIGGILGEDRFDHGIGNLFLLTSEVLKDTTISMTDGQHEVYVVRSRQSIEIKGTSRDTLSMISIEPETHGITSWGLKYDLLGMTITRGSTRGMSNTFLWKKVEISISKGLLLVMVDRQTK